MTYAEVSCRIQNRDYCDIYWGETDPEKAKARFVADYPKYSGMELNVKLYKSEYENLWA